MPRQSLTTRKILFLTLGVFVAILGGAWSWSTAHAATTGPKKVYVYEGVVAIEPGGSSELELGNQGTDIAASGVIDFRPQRLVATRDVAGGRSRGIEFDSVGAAGATDVYIPGRLCINGACLMSCTAYEPDGTTCRTWSPAWPTSASGGLWSLTGAILTPLPQPAGNQRGLTINSSSPKASLTVVNNSSSNPTAFIKNSGSGLSAQFNGLTYVVGNIVISPTDTAKPLIINGGRAWYTGNDGPIDVTNQSRCAPSSTETEQQHLDNCGPDADYLDGIDIYTADTPGWDGYRTGSCRDTSIAGISGRSVCVTSYDPPVNTYALCAHLNQNQDFISSENPYGFMGATGNYCLGLVSHIP